MFPDSNRLLILTVLIGLTAVIAGRSPTIQTEALANAAPGAWLPLHLGSWVGEDVPVPADVQKALPSARILSRQYQGPAGFVNLTIVSGSDATVLHDPHDCLAGDGWHFLKDRSHWVAGDGRTGPLRVRDITMLKSSMLARVWYWYSIGSTTYDSTLPARLGLFRTRLMEGRGRRAEFIRLIAAGDPGSARTTAMLTDLVRQVRANSD